MHPIAIVTVIFFFGLNSDFSGKFQPCFRSFLNPVVHRHESHDIFSFASF